jgi:hypothetical protein
MKGSKKVLIATVAVVGLSLGSISAVSAFGGSGGYGGCDRGQGKGPDKMMEKRGSWMEKKMEDRLGYMKYKLGITAEQEPAWEEFTKALQDKFTNRKERKQNRGEQKTVTEKVNMMREGAKQMTQTADAIEKFYGTLTPEQQKIADEMSPMGKRMHRMRGF